MYIYTKIGTHGRFVESTLHLQDLVIEGSKLYVDCLIIYIEFCKDFVTKDVLNFFNKTSEGFYLLFLGKKWSNLLKF